MNAHGQGTPLPPDGLRPGQLGVVLLGRVIVGDIAATLVDLAGREIVQVAEDQDAGSGPAQASCQQGQGSKRVCAGLKRDCN